MANTFMCFTEEKLEGENKLPSLYKRYADDTLAAVQDIPTATVFLATLKEAHHQAALLNETANNNKPPFIAMELVKMGSQLKLSVSAGKPQTKASFYIIKATLTADTNDPFL